MQACLGSDLTTEMVLSNLKGARNILVIFSLLHVSECN